jgi:toxin ParE1/3/4
MSDAAAPGPRAMYSKKFVTGMAYRVELTTRAGRDLADLYERIQADDSGRANRWFNTLERSIDSLGHLPRRCPAAPEARRAKRNLRQLLHGRKPHVYRIIYEVDEHGKTVQVLTIRHGAMETAQPDELA